MCPIRLIGIWANLMGKIKKENVFLRICYQTKGGRILLKPFVSAQFTKLVGKFMESSVSKFLIPGFIKKNGIDMTIFKEESYPSFNAFFIREKKEILFRSSPNDFCSPGDGFLSKYTIQQDLIFQVKEIFYCLKDLLEDEKIALQYEGGDLLILRLMPNHYHRYHFIDDGIVQETKKIPGKYHTVRPIALRKVPVFIENSREYQVIQTDHFGTIVQMEVGALAVGKILNHPIKIAHKGKEKGYFKFGGSTIILLVKQGVVCWKEKFTEKEVEVTCGQCLGTKKDLP